MAHYINWINGMKLGKAHFLELQSAIWSSLSQSRSLSVSDFNYGVLRKGEESSSFKADINIQQPNIIEVDVKKMTAITANGSLIVVNESDKVKGYFQLDQLELKDENAKYYAIVTADATNPVPYGTPNTDEIPVRLPYLRPSYMVDLISENHLADRTRPGHVIPIAAFLIQRGRIRRIDEYIVPFYRNEDSEEASSFADSYIEFLLKLEDCCTETISKARNKERITNLYKNAIYLCDRLLPQIENSLLHLKLSKYSLNILSFQESSCTLARNIHNSLQIIDPKEREELIQYIAEQTSLTSGEYAQMLGRLFQSEYDHWNIADTLTLLSGFCKITLQLFTKIKESEYVGKKQDAGIIIDERVKKEEESSKKKGWQF